MRIRPEASKSWTESGGSWRSCSACAARSFSTGTRAEARWSRAPRGLASSIAREPTPRRRSPEGLDEAIAMLCKPIPAAIESRLAPHQLPPLDERRLSPLDVGTHEFTVPGHRLLYRAHQLLPTRRQPVAVRDETETSERVERLSVRDVGIFGSVERDAQAGHAG